ncbi:iron transporter [Natronorubrum texcoconense]|uniref:Fe2+ transport protein n=1 Tax=Natronorubrum texcoconense TaxID=1095776 RepID=A0A1G9AHU3_9EURY|nr:iron transporter [Natronorubrum texcoconense]SDK26929.1 Fe2+ transport protein [Natronorubrum texcoconense]
MRRRDVLASGGCLLAAGSAGCLETLRREDAWRELVVDPPEGVYVPPHADGMVTYGTTSADGREISLLASRPHSFWTVAGAERSRADVRSRHDLHLMVDVRDVETGAIVPAPVTTKVRRAESNGREDDRIDERSLWPMLSQRMSPHYGDNVPLEGDGTYVATIEVGPTSANAIGSRLDALEEPTAVDVEFEFDAAEIDGLERRLIDEDEGRGEPGALEPMVAHTGHDHDAAHAGHDHDVGSDHERARDAPLEAAFDSEDATRLGSEASEDIDYTAALVAADKRDGGGPALAVTARTAYNRYPLPFASLAATILSDDERLAGGSLRETVGSRIGHQYRTPVDPSVLEKGDELSIGLETPPQMARHEGYETAFLETETVTIALK